MTAERWRDGLLELETLVVGAQKRETSDLQLRNMSTLQILLIDDLAGAMNRV